MNDKDFVYRLTSRKYIDWIEVRSVWLVSTGGALIDTLSLSDLGHCESLLVVITGHHGTHTRP